MEKDQKRNRRKQKSDVQQHKIGDVKCRYGREKEQLGFDRRHKEDERKARLNDQGNQPESKK